MKQTKPSELFEGNNSTLKQAFDESVSHISHTNINDTRIGSKKPVDWKNQYPLNTLSGTTKQEFEEFIEGLLSMQNTSNVGKNDYKEPVDRISNKTPSTENDWKEVDDDFERVGKLRELNNQLEEEK